MWAETEYGKVDWGDPRRTRPVIKIAVAWALRPSVSG